MNLSKLLRGVVRVIKQNPDKALIVASIIAPGLARKAGKIAPIVIAAAAKDRDS